MQPFVAKFTKDPSDIAHEFSVLQELTESELPLPGIVGPVEQLTFGGGNLISSQGKVQGKRFGSLTLIDLMTALRVMLPQQLISEGC